MEIINNIRNAIAGGFCEVGIIRYLDVYVYEYWYELINHAKHIDTINITHRRITFEGDNFGKRLNDLL